MNEPTFREALNAALSDADWQEVVMAVVTRYQWNVYLAVISLRLMLHILHTTGWPTRHLTVRYGAWIQEVSSG